ncbi:MAG: hypothetical protein LQ338_001220 [Usnochroma carphineum]|nr:MAG: hypothetical protein LQ338_001220 [Usnochroma carphineum]
MLLSHPRAQNFIFEKTNKVDRLSIIQLSTQPSNMVVVVFTYAARLLIAFLLFMSTVSAKSVQPYDLSTAQSKERSYTTSLDIPNLRSTRFRSLATTLSTTNFHFIFTHAYIIFYSAFAHQRTAELYRNMTILLPGNAALHDDSIVSTYGALKLVAS